eukprot:4791870-Prymnesium_polylepis.1
MLVPLHRLRGPQPRLHSRGRRDTQRAFRDVHDTRVAQGGFGDGFTMIATRRAVSASKRTHPFAHHTHRHMRTASRRASAALTQ